MASVAPAASVVAVSPDGAAGIGMAGVVAVAVGVKPEQPPLLHAWTRYSYWVSGSAVVSAKVARSAGGVAIWTKLAPTSRRSIRNSVSVALLSDQLRSTVVVSLAWAVRSVGAVGGVKADVRFEKGEQPAALHARIR